jgi:hypothetical protein
MLLTTGDGLRLSLTIAGYQYPSEHADEYDANWLQVNIEANDGRRGWTSTDPCLLTREVIDLADWFEALAAGQAMEPIRFIEPNLRFELAAFDGAYAKVRVTFELGSTPPWAKSRWVGEHPLSIIFPLTPGELHSAAGNLRRQIETYPARAGR